MTPRISGSFCVTVAAWAHWLDRGWSEEDFFTFTETKREEHYWRYAGVIHLLTAADGASWAYKRRPEGFRPETIEDAVWLDHLLKQVWRRHPRYVRLNNEGCDWAAKSKAARQVLEENVIQYIAI
ncbi:MAG: hypothetical protein QW761_02360 [Candidatus Aenigmatarchaeota archaeon]